MRYNKFVAHKTDRGSISLTNNDNPDEGAGWEHIWSSGRIPPRFHASAEPNPSVAEWAQTIPAGGHVLDVGCGAGWHVLYLGRQGFKVAGMDISPSGIEQCRRLCAERRIEFDGRVSDMNKLPWPDNTFDAALSTSTIHHNLRAGIVEALGEIRRVLKPGGLLLVDLRSTERDFYQTLREQVAAGEIKEVELNTFVDDRPHSSNSDGFLPHHYSDEADARDLLRPFDLLKLFTEHETRKQWVAWARKPLSE
jgi:tellurite methyltransferase